MLIEDYTGHIMVIVGFEKIIEVPLALFSLQDIIDYNKKNPKDTLSLFAYKQESLLRYIKRVADIERQCKDLGVNITYYYNRSPEGDLDMS